MRQSKLRLTFGGRFTFLLTALFIVLALFPLLEYQASVHALLRTFFSILLLSAIQATSGRRWTLAVGVLVIGPAIVVHWICYALHHPALVVADGFLASAVFILTMGTILSAIFREKQVTFETIAGALCVYLLLGLTWAFFYGLIELADPESFQPYKYDDDALEFFLGDPAFSRLVYYSFCTLTTLGLGDISPVKGVARTLSYMEAVVGQFYMAVLVARLVGLHIAHSGKNDRLTI